MAERDIWRRRDRDEPRRQAEPEWERANEYRRRTNMARDYDTAAPLYGERGFGITLDSDRPRYAGASGGPWMAGDTESWRSNQLYGDSGRRSFNDLWQDSYGGGDLSDRDRGLRSGATSIRQSYRGRGPQGYKRSDERVREDVCECLTEDDFVDASDIEVTVKDCLVTLSGTVRARDEKRRAETLAERVLGAKDVQNMLRVSDESSRFTPSTDDNQWSRH